MKTLNNIMQVAFAALMVLLLAVILNIAGMDPIWAVGTATVLAIALSAFDKNFKEHFAGVSFATICGKITQSNSNDCDNPIQSGTRDRMIVLNKDDIDSVTLGADGFTVEAITMKVGLVGYEIDGKNNSIAPKATMVEQGFNNMFDHEVITKGFDISPAAKADLNSAKDGRFVIITENFFRGINGQSAFEIYGLTTGLELTALERDPNNVETQGAFDMTFFTKLNKEPRLPNPLFITDYATTLAVVDGLL